MTDETRDQDVPRVRITDKRRFADGPAPDADTGPGETADGGPSSAEEEAEASGDEAANLATVKAQAQEYLDHLRRLQAEFDNYRKRVSKEQTHAAELAAEPVTRRLLEVLDDFELALMAAERQPDFEKFLKGVELVYAKLLDTLKAEGLERIDAKGRRFDPELHEAMMQTGDGDGEPIVADVLRPGYKLKGRVLRPAGVRVERE